ncbi:hypothetical protein PbJCM13498_27060 [Prolixibacter bellariivorans]|uniref:Uncharacterized protein n=1 Tax=Prolixibacter bellariivorans TaxID=314319 RepID=A0A5M4B211_9BACT|nr:hypothetical protein PbJCM13498_27060 [Prolixibacter bellariivorans]
MVGDIRYVVGIVRYAVGDIRHDTGVTAGGSKMGQADAVAHLRTGYYVVHPLGPLIN